MQVYGPSYLHGPQAVSAPHNARGAAAPDANSATAIRDEVSISSAGSFLDKVHSLPDIRQDRVAQIRDALASGTYLTPDKLDLAMERLLDEVA